MPEGAEGPGREMEDAGTAGGGADGEEPTLEVRLRRLDEIVSALETEDLELDRALALFEEGVAHVRSARKILEEAELRVEELVGDEAGLETRPLDGGNAAVGEGEAE